MTVHIQAMACAGIALGGGLGIGSNRVGPSVDSVLGIDVVSTWQNSTADWDIVRINASSHSDLFWGMLVSCSTVKALTVIMPKKVMKASVDADL